MNHLLNVIELNNKYFIMRHGESTANVEGIIVSTPENGIENYGLSDKGREQVVQSIETAIAEKLLDENTRIISSDFKRTYETAEIANQILGGKYLIEPEPRLRERDFGNFELKSNENYQIVWDKDAIDGSHTSDNVECTEAVMRRATEVVWSLESYYDDQTFLLVAHGDTLQILLTALKKYPASRQRELKHLETAEIRPLAL